MEFYVFEEMKVERIIGIDSIRNMEMVLNFEENILKIGKNELELQRYEEGKCICNSWNEKVNEEGNRMVSEEKDYAVYYEEVDEEQEACDAPDGEFIRNSIYYSVDVDERYLNELLNGISINEERKSELLAMLLKYERIYNHETTFAKDFYHNIDIDDESPLKCKNYPIPHHYKDQVEKEIIQLQTQGIIERSNSYFINPVVLVKKADGTIRICLDAREVNKRIKPGYENPQNMDVLLAKCGKSTIFSKLDLKASFWLIRLTENSKKFCAFSINGNVYQFTVAPFGVKDSPSALIRFLHQILNQYEKFCSHYFDDILIFSKTIEEHVKHLDIILKTLPYGRYEDQFTKM